MTPGNGSLDELERQLERGSLFTHTALGQEAGRLRELEAYVYGLADALLVKQLISSEELADAIDGVHDELDRAGEVSAASVALRIDGEEAARRPAVAVDCDARMHVCQAVCCKLDFALDAEEIERGVIRWDLGRPYMVRHDESGYCVHNDASRRCTVYDDRPRPCRVYSCADDPRIWKDFDAMELNEEWLDDHVVGRTRPLLLQAMLAQPGPEPVG